jgi:hypothetical protein
MPWWDGDGDNLEPSSPQRCSILLIYEKLTNEVSNATKPNNARWRWFRSGQRNPPVISKTAYMHCDRLFKIEHFSSHAL